MDYVSRSGLHCQIGTTEELLVLQDPAGIAFQLSWNYVVHSAIGGLDDVVDWTVEITGLLDGVASATSDRSSFDLDLAEAGLRFSVGPRNWAGRLIWIGPIGPNKTASHNLTRRGLTIAHDCLAGSVRGSVGNTANRMRELTGKLQALRGRRR